MHALRSLSLPPSSCVIAMAMAIVHHSQPLLCSASLPFVSLSQLRRERRPGVSKGGSLVHRVKLYMEPGIVAGQMNVLSDARAWYVT